MKKPEPKEYIEGILSGNRTFLSRAITLVESKRPDHQEMAREVLEGCLPYSGKSIRIGITGVPGVGKSTFIEAFGNHIIEEQGRSLAVLAIDPSSSKTKGSILGDKTRMETLANNPNSFIRPSPSSGSLGGVARKTRESITLCEAAGFDTIIIETVGVGQSETAVHSMVDFFLLLMLAGAGDELQGIKRGIMEMADAIAINKADAGNENAARRARLEYKNALHLFPPTESGWRPKTTTCSALNNLKIDKVWEIIAEYEAFTKKNDYFTEKRNQQALYWLKESINDGLHEAFYYNDDVQSVWKEMEQKILSGEKTSHIAARELLDIFLKK